MEVPGPEKSFNVWPSYSGLVCISEGGLLDVKATARSLGFALYRYS